MAGRPAERLVITDPESALDKLLKKSAKRERSRAILSVVVAP